MLLVDLVYTAFINPVTLVVGWVEPWNSAFILEAVLGLVFVVDLFLGFHVHYVVR
jgi:hypothetical protein